MYLGVVRHQVHLSAWPSCLLHFGRASLHACLDEIGEHLSRDPSPIDDLHGHDFVPRRRYDELPSRERVLTAKNRAIADSEVWPQTLPRALRLVVGRDRVLVYKDHMVFRGLGVAAPEAADELKLES